MDFRHGEGRSVSASPGEDPQAGLGASPRPVRMAAGEAHLYATSPGRPAREDDALGHGVYTWYLLEAMAWGFPKADLDGDGVLTAYEAHDHARGRTIQHTEGVQVPEAAFRVIGEGDLALAGRPGAKARRERALIYLYDTPVADLEVRVDGRDRGLLPGALPVSPGRHQVTVEDAEGREVVAGHMRFEQGRAYTLAEVQRLARGPRLDVSMAAVSLRAPGELGASLGPGALGVELQGSVRDAEDPGRGLTGGLRLGLARAPQREVQDQLVLAPRPVYTLGAQAAWQGDWRRLRLRAGWGLGAVWAPPSPLAGELPQDADPYALPSEAGWWFLETGPDLAVGWVLGENLTLTAQARPHATWLDVTGGGQPHLLGWHVFTLGLAADW